MPENVQVSASLVKTVDVPPDQDCPPSSANDWLQLVVDYIAVQAQDPDAPDSQTDSTAELALNTANNAIAQVASLQGLIPARRTSGLNLVPIASSGDSTVTITWNPEMPNANYSVNLTLHGPIGATALPGYIVVFGSRNVNSVQVRILNVPAGSWSFSWEVFAL